jgi:hypothetical protein
MALIGRTVAKAYGYANINEVLYIGTAAREHVMRHFTWDANAKKMLAVYNFAVGRAARPDFGGRLNRKALLSIRTPCFHGRCLR